MFNVSVKSIIAETIVYIIVGLSAISDLARPIKSAFGCSIAALAKS